MEDDECLIDEVNESPGAREFHLRNETSPRDVSSQANLTTSCIHFTIMPLWITSQQSPPLSYSRPQIQGRPTRPRLGPPVMLRHRD